MTATNEIKNRFFISLKRGTGEAYLILKHYPDIDFSDLLIKGATTNYAFDQQCEGSRAAYIYSLIKLSKEKDKIIKAVLNRLQKEKLDYYGLDQMCDLAVYFYKNGNKQAKEALYKRFEKNLLPGYEFCGQDQLIEIDRMSGVLKVAEIVGKALYNNPDDYENSWRVDEFQKKNKNIAVYEELTKVAQQNPYVHTYLQSILKNKWTFEKPNKHIKFTYELIKERIDADKFRFISVERANELTLEEIYKLADDFLNQKDKSKLEQYLRFFANRQYPYDYQPILRIVKRSTARKTRLVYWAVKSLEYFSGNDLRQLALDKISTLKNPCDYLYLLVNNYQSGDHKLLTEIADRSDNYNFIHSIVSGFIEIYQVNPTADCKEPLERIYNKMNCGIHRHTVVKLLEQNEVLSDKIREELRFDSYEPIRKEYRRRKKKKEDK